MNNMVSRRMVVDTHIGFCHYQIPSAFVVWHDITFTPVLKILKHYFCSIWIEIVIAILNVILFFFSSNFRYSRNERCSSSQIRTVHRDLHQILRLLIILIVILHRYVFIILFSECNIFLISLVSDFFLWLTIYEGQEGRHFEGFQNSVGESDSKQKLT